MQAGVVKQVRTQAVARAKRARAQVVLLLPLIAAVVLAYVYRDRLFGLDVPIRIACVETRSDPEVELEEMDCGHVIFRVRATPADSADGPELADEVVAALDKVSNGRHDG